MAFRSCLLFPAFLLVLIAFPSQVRAEISEEVLEKIKFINERGDYYALVVPGETVLEAALQTFESSMPSIDIYGRRFHIGHIEGVRVILVMLGDGMLNAAQTTQMLLDKFKVIAVIHYGKAGSPKPHEVNLGDIVIPRDFAHCGAWYWEKFGGDANESVNRDIAKLRFADYNVQHKEIENSLENVYVQPGTSYSKPEEGKQTFLMSVDSTLYAVARKMSKKVELKQCVGKSLICLSKKPSVKLGVGIGCSADIFVNNKAFRDFLGRELDAATIDSESAAVAWVCLSDSKPFIAMRSIVDYAGGDLPGENDAKAILSLWAPDAIQALRAYFNELGKNGSNLRSVTGSKIW
uniref:TSA: Wollemia nobilis Ref_Wollemi_Transcript_13168_1277 transcribed RNA sequence n=1 Tax=Wollemia nobilis TaxID=56998 RepID=A0A0C9RU00_9CONI